MMAELNLRAHHATRLTRAIAVTALVALVAMVYWPGVHGGFVFDDYQNIVDNPGFRSDFSHWRDWIAVALSSSSSALQRPLSMLTFIANVHFFGLDPVAMKLTNIVIHALNVVLVFVLARALLDGSASRQRQGIAVGPRAWAPLFVAAAWGLHPINLMAVLYVVQRMESLCHTFVFLGLRLYVQGRRRQLAGTSGGWLHVGMGLIGCTILGLLCKESAALLPLYAFGIELCVFRFHGSDTRVDRRLAGLYVLVLALPALAAVAWLLPQALRPDAYASRAFTLVERLLTEPRVVLDYLRWILAPDLHSLGLYHDDIVVSRGLLDPPATAVAIGALLLLAAGAWWVRKRRPFVALGIFWFLAAQALTGTFIPLDLAYEHRNYFASLGICVALADLLLCVPPPAWRRIGVLLACCFVLYCAGITWLRAREWSNAVRFSSTEAAKHPFSPRATYDYARTLIIVSNYDRHSPVFDRVPAAIAHAQQAPGSGALADQAALLFAARTGTAVPAGTWESLQRKLRQQHSSPEAQLALRSLVDCAIAGHCDLSPGNMLATFGAALENGADPAILDIYAQYASRVLGDNALALRARQQAVVQAPGVARYRANLAMLLIEMDRFNDARTQVAALRRLGNLAQYESLANQLERMLILREASRSPGKVPASSGTPAD